MFPSSGRGSSEATKPPVTPNAAPSSSSSAPPRKDTASATPRAWENSGGTDEKLATNRRVTQILLASVARSFASRPPRSLPLSRFSSPCSSGEGTDGIDEAKSTSHVVPEAESVSLALPVTARTSTRPSACRVQCLELPPESRAAGHRARRDALACRAAGLLSSVAFACRRRERYGRGLWAFRKLATAATWGTRSRRQKSESCRWQVPSCGAKGVRFRYYLIEARRQEVKCVRRGPVG